MCNHPYRKPTRGPLWRCLSCRQYFIPEEKKKAEAVPILLPPVIFTITERLWEDVAPWPLMPFKIVKKYGWYISMLHGHLYLVMPITHEGESVFYSARLLDKAEGAKKYDYPEGATRVYWTSSKRLSSPVFFCEGVADAAYMAQWGSSVALLGNHYDGSLDGRLKGKRVLVMLDGDAVGCTSAVRIAARLSNASVVALPSGKDPTDLKLPVLRKILKSLGVRL